MQNEIPAGTKVKVTITSKGETTLHDAEVLAHMDGVVHVDMDGEALSVDPSQIVLPDTPAVTPGPANTIEKLENVNPEIMDQLEKQMALLETVPAIEARVSKLESDFLDLQARVTAALTPAPAATEEIPNDDASTTSPASAEPAGNDPNANPDAAADAAG